jgi:hypothetical protein
MHQDNTPEKKFSTRRLRYFSDALLLAAESSPRWD